ncbi:hypothetical protein COPCOM_03325 [Coprococcus comes ATCC 27758]|uniref:Uncharacterized protein n=1 Tax=Coprococcus comes ATCC 27758 TaxID=470146 RepID=C0BDS1_9FIRM|nr:hypothetical protein COPCOM_03325 [Coprococcus comes ATCC 27758]
MMSGSSSFVLYIRKVPRHILSYNWKITGFFQIKCKKGRKEKWNRKR